MAGQSSLSSSVEQSQNATLSPETVSRPNEGQSVTSASKPKNGPEVGQKKHGPPVRVIVIVAILILGIVGYNCWNYFQEHRDTGKLKTTGRIEGYETNVGAKIGGRVEMIAVREGDLVKVGQMLVKLSDDDYQAQLRGAKARLKKAEEARDQAVDQVEVAKSTVLQAEISRQQSVEDAKGRIEQAGQQVAGAENNLSQAEAQLAESVADLKLAELRKERYDSLAKEGAVQQDQADQADTTLATARATVLSRKAAVLAAQKSLNATRGNLGQVRSTRLNPGIRSAELLSAQRQLTQANSQLVSANHEIQNAKAAEDEIAANIAYLNIPSPIDGVVTARAVEPGAVVVPGQTVLSLINLQTVYLRFYIPEGQVGKIRVGQEAIVYLDSDSKRGFPSKVIEIDPQASFTPENIYFKDDRVKQVFGGKIAINDPQRFPKPGMPADAEIILDQPK